MKTVKSIIKEFLDELSKKDELFQKYYAKENKNFEDCFKYIISEVRKKGTQVYMSDKEVFGLAIHYYEEDDLKISSASIEHVAVAATAGDFSPEEKKAERVNKAAAKKKADKAQKRKKEEEGLMLLFDEKEWGNETKK